MLASAADAFDMEMLTLDRVSLCFLFLPIKLASLPHLPDFHGDTLRAILTFPAPFTPSRHLAPRTQYPALCLRSHIGG